MTLPANIRVNVRAPFPYRVSGASFITVKKVNGIWTIAPDYTVLANAPVITQTQVIVAYDEVAETYSLLNAASLFAIVSGIYREFTEAGNVTALPTDVTILMAQQTPAAVNVILPFSATRAGLPITVKDYAGVANTDNITFVPQAGETIDGFSGAAAAANGVAVIDINYGSKTLYPLSSGGWYVR